MKDTFLLLMFSVIAQLYAIPTQRLNSNIQLEYKNVVTTDKRPSLKHIVILQKPIRGIASITMSNAPVYNRPTRQSLELLSKYSDHVTYIDGIKVIGEVNIPLSAIDYLYVMDRGISAEYGDVSFGRIETNSDGYSMFKPEN